VKTLLFEHTSIDVKFSQSKNADGLITVTPNPISAETSLAFKKADSPISTTLSEITTEVIEVF
jgi:hypothetical protein